MICARAERYQRIVTEIGEAYLSAEQLFECRRAYRHLAHGAKRGFAQRGGADGRSRDDCDIRRSVLERGYCLRGRVVADAYANPG